MAIAFGESGSFRYPFVPSHTLDAKDVEAVPDRLFSEGAKECMSVALDGGPHRDRRSRSRALFHDWLVTSSSVLESTRFGVTADHLQGRPPAKLLNVQLPHAHLP